MNNDYCAADAARLLGVSLATLYSYVSRGWLTPGAAQQGRRKRYPQEQVLRLAARKADGKRGGHLAAAAMNWGVPVMETRISRIADGRLHYRGHDAVLLAGHATLEATACLLWDDAGVDVGNTARQDHFSGAAPALPALPSTTLPVLEQAMALLPLAAQALPEPASTFTHGAALMRLLAALLLGTVPSTCRCICKWRARGTPTRNKPI